MKATQTKSPLNKFLHYRHHLRFAIFRRDGFRCRYCGRSVQDGVVLELEHIQPLSRGGSFAPENLVTSCHECNRGKDDISLDEVEIKLLRNPSFLFADWPVVGWKAVAL